MPGVKKIVIRDAHKIVRKQTIEDIEYQGHGITRIDGFVVFVDDALPGEVVDLKIYRKRSSFAFARVLEYHRLSDKRIDPFCKHFWYCGGCKWQYLPYDEQCAYKEYFVSEIMRKIGKVEDPPVQPLIPSPRERFYRNKLAFSFSSHRWLLPGEASKDELISEKRGLGFHIRGRYDRVLDIQDCYLQDSLSNQIRNDFRDFAFTEDLSFFDHKKYRGFLRNLIIRNSIPGEWMIALVFAEQDNEKIGRCMEFLATRFPQIDSLYYIINKSKNDSLERHEAVLYSGKPYINEQCGSITLQIHPNTFYQTNPRQAERMYEKVLRSAGLSGRERVLDLYSGIGSIGLYLSPHCRYVLGIENVYESVQLARENAENNRRSNCEFIQGEVENVLDQDFFARRGRFDLAVIDPPRSGLHKNVVDELLSAEIPHIIYVSCNPATQARDLLALREKYRLESIQPLDMFPHTFHIETIVDLRFKA